MLEDLTQSILIRSLDAAAVRNRTLANNIANVETPEYRRQDVAFEDELRSALETPAFMTGLREGELAQVKAQAVPDTVSPARENGNNVDIDEEMARLAENTLHYQTLIQSYQAKDSMLRTAIYEGRK